MADVSEWDRPEDGAEAKAAVKPPAFRIIPLGELISEGEEECFTLAQSRDCFATDDGWAMRCRDAEERLLSLKALRRRLSYAESTLRGIVGAGRDETDAKMARAYFAVSEEIAEDYRRLANADESCIPKLR